MGYVYLICDPQSSSNNGNGCYKIGVTTCKSIEKRLKQLQTGNSNELHIANYHETDHPFKIEKLLHARFCCYNKLNEWFDLEPEDVINFSERCQECENTYEALKDNPFFN